MGGQIDLHIHSEKSSDGSLSLSEIVHLAKKKALRAISITDHDTVAGYPEVLHLAEEAQLEVIPGIELTTLFDNREFHLLLPFVDWKRQIVKNITKEVSARRGQEARERVNKLQELGFDISWEEVIKESGPFPPLGVTIAQIILKKAKKKGQPGFHKYFEDENWNYAPYLFYKDYFTEGRPASVPRRNLHLLEILEIVPQTGGVAVLAHPGAYFQCAQKKDIALLKEKGLKGLEVYTSYHDASQTALYKRLAEEYDLVPTAGSDFHGEIKPQIPFGSIKNGGYWMVKELEKRRP